eukprot:gb/GFBE01018720.1/.p1 GENE.gb/GFBE01018720.1/~~gb/GFBE01018720.1/.p1  ORF type:complete len:273 (+),score=38.35 gb/GFBE01018720.1/:1-819(+)
MGLHLYPMSRSLAGQLSLRRLGPRTLWAVLVTVASLGSFARPHCFAQLRAAGAEAVINTLRGAAALPREGSERPPQEEVLSAILAAQRQKDKLNAEQPFFQKLHGGGQVGGKRWRLVYLATRNAVVAARKGKAPPSPLDRGWYVDGIVTAVQRFEDSTVTVNQNGVFELFGLGGFFFGYFARWKWPSPEKRTTMAFQPTSSNVHAFGNDWSSPAGSKSESEFMSARLQDLNIFNFLYVDDRVAVAQGASGSIALWGATDAAWESQHLVSVEQ